MDQAPSKRFWPQKFIQKEEVGRKNRRYYKRGPGYICQVCPYASNKTCGKCIYARWNVDGVLAGFSPSRAYRESHKDDITASPLLMQFENDPRLNIIPKSPSLNRTQLAVKLLQVKRVIG